MVAVVLRWKVQRLPYWALAAIARMSGRAAARVTAVTAVADLLSQVGRGEQCRWPSQSLCVRLGRCGLPGREQLKRGRTLVTA